MHMIIIYMHHTSRYNMIVQYHKICYRHITKRKMFYKTIISIISINTSNHINLYQWLSCHIIKAKKIRYSIDFVSTLSMESLESGCCAMWSSAVPCCVLCLVLSHLHTSPPGCLDLCRALHQQLQTSKPHKKKRKRTPQRCALTALKHIKPYSTLFNHIKPKERRNMLEHCRNLWDQDRSSTLTSFLDFALCPHVSTWSTWSKGTRTEWSECATWFAQKLGAWKRPCSTLHGVHGVRGERGELQGPWTKLCRCTKV